MTKWRPAGWKEQQEAAHANHVRKGYAGVDLLNYDRGFEAGADALLVALREQAWMIHESPVLIAEHIEAAVKEGYWVFIPDDPEEAHGH